MFLVRVSLILLTPLIVFGIPSDALFQQQAIVILAIPAAGIVGMFARIRSMVLLSYGSLMLLTIWGKVASDIGSLPGPDSAVFLAEFMLVILLMEASLAILNFDNARQPLKDKVDDLSSQNLVQLSIWLTGQLFNLGRITLAGFGLALALLLVGTFVSVSFNQLAFSGALVLGVVVVLMLLVTYRREPKACKT